MADTSEPAVAVSDSPSDADRAAIGDGLAGYNETRAGPSDARPLAVLARDPDSGATIGGLYGRTYLGLLTIERFFLPEALRRNRLGSRVLALAEEEGRRRGCTRAVLSTLHFQAPGFYMKQGWEVAARIDVDPPGHTRFYMTKKLV
ncbi:MAG TPA: GNAT family N-acetyltransferase [Stellaceae bacterium]|nr:GNAT family N-acetyltransferase [Stellaceae bacterium]